MTEPQHPHQGQPLLTLGAPLEQARAAMIMLHGRRGTAQDILSLAPELDQPGFAYLAPQAASNEWYPNSFLTALEGNWPHLSSAMRILDDLLAQAADADIPPERVMLLGFSQGACLASEYLARHTRRYGGLVGFSGGLIGLDDTPRDYAGSLDGTPVFLGCSEVDSYIPKARVQLTTRVLRGLDAVVIERFYPGLGHSINRDELNFAREMMAALLK
jgi:phospholipase/carboxylesterase